jgi:3-phosphoglycerate kinase
MFKKKTIEDIDLKNKRVIVRVDYNIPLDAEGNVVDNTRIKLSLPTLKYLIENRAKIILMSHLGRPKGEVDEKYRLTPAVEVLERLIKKPIKKFDEIYSEKISDYISNDMKPGEIVMLENLRFSPGEKSNDRGFARELASLADIYVDDAFGAAHRDHASIVGVPEYLPAVSGFLMKKEVEVLSKLLENPERPFIAVLGGSKVSDKIKVIQNLMDKVDVLILGGGMTYTFLKAKGYGIGRSICEEDQLQYSLDMIALAKKNGVKMMLPVDIVVAKEFSEDAESKNVSIEEIPEEWEGMGIGAMTTEAYIAEISKAGTVFWNGPMGVFEFKNFEKSTREISTAISNSSAITVVGGGDTLAAIKKFGLNDKFSHVSSGGGAAMEFLEGKILPGIAVLMDKGGA